MPHFTPVAPELRNRLRSALDHNQANEWAILTGADTSFVGSSPELPTDQAVVNAIKSVGCHY